MHALNSLFIIWTSPLLCNIIYFTIKKKIHPHYIQRRLSISNQRYSEPQVFPCQWIFDLFGERVTVLGIDKKDIQWCSKNIRAASLLSIRVYYYNYKECLLFWEIHFSSVKQLHGSIYFGLSYSNSQYTFPYCPLQPTETHFHCVTYSCVSLFLNLDSFK